MVVRLQSIVTQRWELHALAPPAIHRHCRGCGTTRAFHSAGRFRVNAQQRHLDVWLLYACERCEQIWNRPLHDRVRAGSLPPVEYQGLLANDPNLARAWAFRDVGLARQGLRLATVDSWALTRSGPDVGPPLVVELHLDDPVRVRADQVLARGLGRSRSRIASMFREGRIRDLEGDRRAARRPARHGQSFVIGD